MIAPVQVPAYVPSDKANSQTPFLCNAIEPLLLLHRHDEKPRARVIWTRPLGPTESYFLRMGRGKGWADPFVVSAFTFKPPTTNSFTLSERIRLGWATLRARHPLLSSVVYSAPGGENFVCPRPVSTKEALEQGEGSFEHTVCTSETFLQEVDAHRARWGGPREEFVLSSEKQLSRFALIENSDENGLHAVAVYGTHFVSDAFALLAIVSELFEFILSPRDPWEMLEEALRGEENFPPSIDDLIDEKRFSMRKGTEAEAAEAYKILSGPSQKTRHGLFPDGTSAPEKVTQIVDRRVLSPSETAKLIRAGKAHGVSVTAVVSAALSLVACEIVPAPIEGESFGKLHLPVDLSSRGATAAREGKNELALRAGRYPIWVNLTPTSTIAREERFWELARICHETSAKFIKSPHFWDFLVDYSADSLAVLKAGPPPPTAPPVPILPLLSSVGKLDATVPQKIGSFLEHQGEIHVDDVIVNMKVLPVVPSVHVWTYGGKLSIQITYSEGYTSKALMGMYWEGVVNLLRSL